MEPRTGRRSVLWQRPRRRRQGQEQEQTTANHHRPIAAAAGPGQPQDQTRPPIAAVVLGNNYYNSTATATATATSSMFAFAGTAADAGTVLPTARTSNSNVNNIRTNSNNKMIRNGNSGTNSKHQLLHPSRRVDQGDDSPVNSPVHQRPRLTGISVASAGMVVSRLPSHRELSSMSLLSRAESCTSHSTGAEFDSWAVQHQPQQRQYQRGSSRASVMSSVSAASASMMVSRLPSHRELSQSLNRTESFAYHSHGAEFFYWGRTAQ
jgi:hypothetical protein